MAPAHREALLQAQAMMDTAALIRNHLAALVHSTECRLRGAKPNERAAVIEEMVNFVLSLSKGSTWPSVGLAARSPSS